MRTRHLPHYARFIATLSPVPAIVAYSLTTLPEAGKMRAGLMIAVGAICILSIAGAMWIVVRNLVARVNDGQRWGRALAAMAAMDTVLMLVVRGFLFPTSRSVVFAFVLLIACFVMGGAWGVGVCLEWLWKKTASTSPYCQEEARP